MITITWTVVSSTTILPNSRSLKPVPYGPTVLLSGACCSFSTYRVYLINVTRSIVSVGTGLPQPNPGSENVLSLLGAIIDICTNSDAIHKRVKAWLDFLQIQPSYFRFDANPPVGSLRLDTGDKATLEQMCAQTEAYMNEGKQCSEVERLMQILSGEKSGFIFAKTDNVNNNNTNANNWCNLYNICT